jgi:hypothetical protein
MLLHNSVTNYHPTWNYSPEKSDAHSHCRGEKLAKMYQNRFSQNLGRVGHLVGGADKSSAHRNCSVTVPYGSRTREGVRYEAVSIAVRTRQICGGTEQSVKSHSKRLFSGETETASDVYAVKLSP